MKILLGGIHTVILQRILRKLAVMHVFLPRIDSYRFTRYIKLLLLGTCGEPTLQERKSNMTARFVFCSE